MVVTRRQSRSFGHANEVEQQQQKQKPSGEWEKVLYRKQPFPDNHTDPGLFLDQLRTNVDVVRYSLLEAVRGGATLMGQADLVVIYLATFELTQRGQWASRALLLANFGAISCLCLCLCQGRANFFRLDHWRTLATILAFGYAFTPLIRTLSTSISLDSIWASAILLFLASLLFHDYGLEGAPIASTPLSLNLCLAASVFLISRVETDPPAFLLLGLSLLLFCFWPPLRNALLSRWPNLVFLALPPPALDSIWLLICLDLWALAIGHFLLHLFIVGFCPWLLVRMQQRKRWKREGDNAFVFVSTIHGPWDEATLRASTKSS